MNEKRICLGKIVGVHGIRGEVKVKSFTAVDKNIGAYGELEDKFAKQKFSLKVTGHSKELLRVKINGIDDRTTAETLIGTELYACRDVLPNVTNEEVKTLLDNNPNYILCGETQYLKREGFETNIFNQMLKIRKNATPVEDILGLKPAYLKN